jgi:hypothetical protein
MGCYPLFACTDWSGLRADLDLLSADLVSLSLVADPFGDYNLEQLQSYFDFVLSFKRHFVTNLREPLSSFVSKNHQRHVRKALQEVHVQRCEPAIAFLDEWTAFYAHLQARHSFGGIQAFSRAAFAKQLTVPGLVVFRAAARDRAVGIHLWYVHGSVAYYHLGATSAEGYRLSASYALFWHALNSFRSEVPWLDLGGVPGLDENASSGLRQFKAGWATGTRPAFFCGKVLQPASYNRLVQDLHPGATRYFPAYRAGEHRAGAAASSGGTERP